MKGAVALKQLLFNSNLLESEITNFFRNRTY